MTGQCSQLRFGLRLVCPRCYSALVTGQASSSKSGPTMAQLCFYNFLDIACALGVALVVNVAVLLVSAATFHASGVTVETLQEAHDVMEKVLSSSLAPAAFGMALLCAGQLSTFTGEGLAADCSI